MRKVKPKKRTTAMDIQVKKVDSQEGLETVFAIREKVFVEEQKVSKEEEYDEFEIESHHFLATLDGKPAGTARWRFTETGIKLERFAVLEPLRGKGIAKALVATVLADISGNPQANGKMRYMHAQLAAVPLYEKFGFQKEGDIFMECDIAHYKMKMSFE